MKAVAFSSDDLRRHIMWSADDSRSSVSSLYLELFGSTHIYQLQIPICAHHQVFRLEISVYDLV